MAWLRKGKKSQNFGRFQANMLRNREEDAESECSRTPLFWLVPGEVLPKHQFATFKAKISLVEESTRDMASPDSSLHSFLSSVPEKPRKSQKRTRTARKIGLSRLNPMGSFSSMTKSRQMRVQSNAKNNISSLRGSLQIDVQNKAFVILFTNKRKTLKFLFNFRELEEVEVFKRQKVVKDKRLSLDSDPFLEASSEPQSKKVSTLTLRFSRQVLNGSILRSKTVKSWRLQFLLSSEVELERCLSLIQSIHGSNHPLTKYNQPVRKFSRMVDLRTKTLKVWVGSFNMGNENCPKTLPTQKGFVCPIELWCGIETRPGNLRERRHCSFSSTFLKEEERYEKRLAESLSDVYCFGLQESKKGVLKQINTLMSNNGLIRVGQSACGVIRLLVYVKHELATKVTDVETVFLPFGVGGVYTNKGSVALAMCLEDQPLLFVNSHLAAKEAPKFLLQRNKTVKKTIRDFKLGKISETEFLSQFSVFWCGDLNYRIRSKKHWEVEDTFDSITASLATGTTLDNRELFLEKDTLNIEKRKNEVFVGFSELVPSFRPTYKYFVPTKGNTTWNYFHRNIDGVMFVDGMFCKQAVSTAFSRRQAIEDLGERKASEIKDFYYISCKDKEGKKREFATKKRCPSFCDRVLFRGLPNCNVTQISYKSIDNIYTSDHHPVSAEFEFSFPSKEVEQKTAQYLTCAVQFLSCDVISLRHYNSSVRVLIPTEDVVKEGYSVENKITLDFDYPPKTEQDLVKSAALNKALFEAKYFNDKMRQKTNKGGAMFSFDGKSASNGVDKFVDSLLPNCTHDSLRLSVQSSFMAERSTLKRTTSDAVGTRLGSHSFLNTESQEELLQRVRDLPEDSPAEVSFDAEALKELTIGPFLSTCEYLSCQTMVLHVEAPAATARDFESVGSCVLDLRKAAMGRISSFCEPIVKEGSLVGFVRGKFRVLLEDAGLMPSLLSKKNHIFFSDHICVIPEAATRSDSDFPEEQIGERFQVRKNIWANRESTKLTRTGKKKKDGNKNNNFTGKLMNISSQLSSSLLMKKQDPSGYASVHQLNSNTLRFLKGDSDTLDLETKDGNLTEAEKETTDVRDLDVQTLPLTDSSSEYYSDDDEESENPDIKYEEVLE